MHYALMFHEAPTETARRGGPDAEDYWASWTNYMAVLRERAGMLGGNALHPNQGTDVSHSADGTRLIEDGPYAESREELGGYVVIDVSDLDAAIEMASLAPCAKHGAGRVVVHPVMEMSADSDASEKAA